MIVKPCKFAEIDFYKSTFEHPDILAHIPTFFGTLALSSPQERQARQELQAWVAPTDRSSHRTSKHLEPPTLAEAQQAWAPSNGGKITTDSAIVLENVAAGYKKPNILDVKLGSRLWADDAPPAKRARLDKVAGETTSKPLGYRIAGMKTWQGKEAIKHHVDVSLDGYKTYSKEYGRKFTIDTVHVGFEEYFFNDGAGVIRRLAKRVIRRFVADLKDTMDYLSKEETRMYSASLLFVYEGEGEALEKAFQEEKELIRMRKEMRQVEEQAPRTPNEETNGTSRLMEAALHRGAGLVQAREQAPQQDSEGGTVDDGEEDEEVEEIVWPKIQVIKLIDFAHASWTPGAGPDENVLHGIRNVICLLEKLLDRDS